jgi:PAS domain S-box-containing protein
MAADHTRASGGADLVPVARTVSRVAGAGAVLLGLVQLALWALGVPARWAAEGAITMKTNLALAHVLAGAALVLLGARAATSRRRAVAAAAAAVVLALGALTLAEHLLRIDLGIDQLLASEPPGAPGTAAPNRMGPPAAATLVLLGSGLLLLAARRRGSALLGAIAFCVVLTPAVGLLYGVLPLRGVPTLTGIAAPSILGLLLLASGLAAAPNAAAPSLLWRADPGGVLLRRMAIPAVLIPVALGYLRLEGERSGLYGTSVGTGLFAVSLASTFLLLLWRSASRLSASSAERLRAEDARRATEERARAQAVELEAVLNCVADGVIVYDREGRTVHSTPSAEAILGVPLRERTRPVRERIGEQYEIVAEDGRTLGPEEMAAVRAAVGGETIRGEVVRIRTAGREPRWIRMNATPLLLNGAHTGAVLSFTDITERKRGEEALRDANERLREADRRKDEFLGVLSHELRNPLAPIRNALTVLDRADPGGAQAERARAVLKRQVAHLARLVDDLLDVTRVARGKIHLRRADLDLAGLARHVAEDHRALLQAAGIAFEVRLPGEPVAVHADEARITQIIGNLLQNAAKFTGEGGRVTLSVGREGGEVAIRVRDTGEGIAPDLLPRLFQPFTQAKQTLARSDGGLGLGLALVKGLAELHGGTVAAASAAPGAGAEFTVRLPLAEPRPATAAGTRSASGPAAAGGRRRVLVVDDNVDAADTLAALVRMLGHDVDVAYDGPTALEKFVAERPAVVLCDVGLPGMSGYEIAREVRARHDGPVRLVAVTGYAQPEDVRRAKEAGFDAHVAKPPDPEQIERLLG